LAFAVAGIVERVLAVKRERIDCGGRAEARHAQRHLPAVPRQVADFQSPAVTY
jgi:hypothetical protein